MLSSKNAQLVALQAKLDEANHDIRSRDDRIHALQEKVDKIVSDKVSKYCSV
jgi:hypothetical protein